MKCKYQDNLTIEMNVLSKIQKCSTDLLGIIMLEIEPLVFLFLSH